MATLEGHPEGEQSCPSHSTVGRKACFLSGQSPVTMSTQDLKRGRNKPEPAVLDTGGHSSWLSSPHEFENYLLVTLELVIVPAGKPFFTFRPGDTLTPEGISSTAGWKGA